MDIKAILGSLKSRDTATQENALKELKKLIEQSYDKSYRKKTPDWMELTCLYGLTLTAEMATKILDRRKDGEFLFLFRLYVNTKRPMESPHNLPEDDVAKAYEQTLRSLDQNARDKQTHLGHHRNSFSRKKESSNHSNQMQQELIPKSTVKASF